MKGSSRAGLVVVAAILVATLLAVIADVEVIEANADLGSQVGPAWMGIGVWASSADVDGDLIDTLALGVGAVLRGKVGGVQNRAQAAAAGHALRVRPDPQGLQTVNTAAGIRSKRSPPRR